MEHTLEIKGLTMSYGKRYVVKDVSLFVRRGEIVGLLGSNGAGKTTTFNMIVGIIRPEQGRIALDGKDISNLPMYKRARKGMGYLPQEPSIFMKLSVKENLKAVLEIRNTNGKIYNSLNEEVDRLIEEFNLSDFADRNGYKLSGGERRRAEIARAIALNPTFMLFDEPFTGIDPITISELKKMLTYLKSKGLGILITDHNVRETLSITDRAYIINDGSVLADGRPDELVSNPSVRESYLGEEFRL
ncbi:LPS export ABC transporter ATP-binding protein [Thermodesulfovibrionales bacterium]|nr:LPS export ABC transporter ATP-binding protein [Thermodesulfovibrionales bacterium]